MNEEETKKIYRKKTRKEQGKKQRHFADKLKTEEDKRGHAGAKLKTGKTNNPGRAELLSNTRVKRQSRAKLREMSYELAAQASRRGSQVLLADNTQDNGEDVSAQITEEVYADIRDISAYTTKNIKKRYSNKLHDKARVSKIKSPRENKLSPKTDEGLGERSRPGTLKAEKIKQGLNGSNEKSRQMQKLRLKKKLSAEGYKGRLAGGNFGDLVKSFFENTGEWAVEKLAENPIGVVMAVIGLIIVLTVCGMTSSCSLALNGSGDATIATTFTAHDEDILDTNDDYKDLEEELGEFLEEYEIIHPGYDEYKYELDEIGHNPYELAALLTVLYEDYRESEVQEMIKRIYKMQYEITETETTETRTKTVTNEETGEDEEVEYEARIMTVTMTNKGIDAVARNIGLDEDEIARYELLVETYGNKKYLFEDDIYAVMDKGTFGDYKIPSEFLTDEEFAKLINEAEKYLGTEYVWGGSNPTTGFDCSGFVSYVLNHSGNGVNVGRPTANGLANMCTQVSKTEAKPGDLIFFKNTYSGAPNGASHVGIYVGDGMMIHCGNPVQYTSVESTFWQNHLLGYGRLDNEE